MVRDATLVSFLHLVWQHVNVLLPGAVLAPGTRTVTSMLQMRGRRAASDFQTSHRGRTRAVWSPRTASRLLRRLAVAVCSPAGGVGFGRDDTMERRRGAQSTATGLSRAPVQSSHAHGVNVSGRRWLAGRLRGPLAWADRVGARPWRTVRWPSERFEAPRGRRQQPLTARAGQRIRRVVRWMPGRESALVPDSRVAALELRATVTTVRRGRVRVRLRLDAALSAPPPPRVPGTIGRPRLQGQRRPTLEAVLAAERTPWTPAHVAQGRGAPPRARRPASLAGRVRSR